MFSGSCTFRNILLNYLFVNVLVTVEAHKIRLFAVFAPFVATKWQHYLNYCKSKELSDFLKV